MSSATVRTADFVQTPADASAVASRPVESRDPATGELWKSFEPTSAAAVGAATGRARAAQPGWAAQPLAVRVRVLRRFHECLYRRRLEVAAALTRENGKPAAEALGSEIAIALDFAQFYAKRAPGFLRAPWVNAQPLAMKRKRVRVEHDPFGVIGVISPWNYPFMLSAAIALPALVTGNAVLLKPSEFTPYSGQLLQELFDEAGVPAGVFAVLQGDGATGASLCDAAVDKIFFTGSVATGRKVAVRCAERLIPCSLELGGSDPAIVLADADIQHAASGIAWGRFSNAGQTCVAPKRVFVEAAAYDAFVAALAKTVNGLRVGAGSNADSDVGPVIRSDAVATLTAQYANAIVLGANVAARASDAAASGGNYFTPTVLTDVAPDSRVLTEETFGPLLPVVKVRDADEAVALANASEFGLSASVWTRDSAKGAALARRLEVGTVAVNDAIIVAGMADVPHGGVKNSGIGRTHGMAGLEECVRTKATVVDRFPSWRQAWWFGYSSSHLSGVDAYVRFAHGRGVMERLAALPGFLRFVFQPRRPV